MLTEIATATATATAASGISLPLLTSTENYFVLTAVVPTIWNVLSIDITYEYDAFCKSAGGGMPRSSRLYYSTNCFVLNF